MNCVVISKAVAHRSVERIVIQENIVAEKLVAQLPVPQLTFHLARDAGWKNSIALGRAVRE